MMQQTELPAPNHRLVLEQRKSLSVTGVTEVVSFDENLVHLKTQQGILLIYGEGLSLKNLTQQGGQVAVEGLVKAMQYEEAKAGAGGFLRRLFG